MASKFAFSIGSKVRNLLNSGAVGRKEGVLQSYRNDLLKLGAKPWDIAHTLPAGNEVTDLDSLRRGVSNTLVDPLDMYDYTIGPLMYSDDQRVLGNLEGLDFLNPYAYKEVAFNVNPRRFFRPGKDYQHYRLPSEFDRYSTPLGLSLKASKGSNFLDLLKRYDFEPVSGAVNYGHFGLPLHSTKPYILGHTRHTDFPDTLGNWRMVEEMQSDLNPYYLKAGLKARDFDLGDQFEKMLHIPEEVAKGKDKMVSSLTLANAAFEGRRGVAIPPLEYLARLRNYTPSNIPPHFRSMYGATLDNRLKDAERLGLGIADTIKFRDVPKFMTEGGDYSGRDWANVLNTPSFDLRQMPFRVFKFSDDAPQMASDLELFSSGGLVGG